MSAVEPRATAKRTGITFADLVDEVRVVRSYPHEYLDEDGEPVRFIFSFREPSQREQYQHLRRQVAQTSTGREKQRTDLELDEFCAFLIREPEGFDDFPVDGRPIAERAREYFGREKAGKFVSHALTGLWQAVMPAEFFR